MDYIDYGVAHVSFKTLVDVLDKARVLTPEFVSYRMEHATRKRGPYATINEVTQGFVRVGASEVLRPVLRSSQEVFDTFFANAVYRQDPAWASILTGLPGRSEGWRVRDMIEVLGGLREPLLPGEGVGRVRDGYATCEIFGDRRI